MSLKSKSKSKLVMGDEYNYDNFKQTRQIDFDILGNDKIHHRFTLEPINNIEIICPEYSKLLIYKNEEECKKLLKTKTEIERMLYIRSITKNIPHCQHPIYGCGALIPKIKVEIKKTSTDQY